MSAMEISITRISLWQNKMVAVTVRILWDVAQPALLLTAMEFYNTWIL